jgi:hypothetical protein
MIPLRNNYPPAPRSWILMPFSSREKIVLFGKITDSRTGARNIQDTDSSKCLNVRKYSKIITINHNNRDYYKEYKNQPCPVA